MYFHADEHGNPDLSRPLTEREHVEVYWASVDNDPYSLADFTYAFTTSFESSSCYLKGD